MRVMRGVSFVHCGLTLTSEDCGIFRIWGLFRLMGDWLRCTGGCGCVCGDESAAGFCVCVFARNAVSSSAVCSFGAVSGGGVYFWRMKGIVPVVFRSQQPYLGFARGLLKPAYPGDGF